VRTTCRSWDEGVLTDVRLTGVLTDLCLTLYYRLFNNFTFYFIIQNLKRKEKTKDRSKIGGGETN